MSWSSSFGAQQKIRILLDLAGTAATNAGLRLTAKNVERLGYATTATGQAMRVASQRTWLQNQALFTMRRYAFFGTLAITGLAVGLAKLGYGYLATRDAAKAALRVIIPSTALMNSELATLFRYSKYSPFVLKDMTKAFAVMYPALHSAGLGVGEINSLLLSMTNFLSQSLRTTPAALNQIAYAVQHMLYQGRLTGRLTQSLAAAGVPVPELLKRLGYANANLSSIARLNISPQNVIRALTAMGQEGIFKGAARRQALESLPGMFQVLKDSLSQLVGQAGESGYNRFKNNMKELVGPGGFLDRLSTAKTPSQAIMMLSKGLTGGGGAGKGMLLFAQTISETVHLFAYGVIPAFAHAAKVLALFGIVLYPLNITLRFLNRNLWLVKTVLVPLAAWFIITHTAMVGVWLTGKLMTIMFFGQAGAIKKLVVMLFTAEGRYGIMLGLKRLWIILTVGETAATEAWGAANAINYTRTELLMFRVRNAAVTMGLTTRAAWLNMLGPLALVLAALYEINKQHDRIVSWTGIGSVDKKTHGGLSIAKTVLRPAAEYFHLPIYKYAGGGTSRGGPALVGENGPEVLNLNQGDTITPFGQNGPIVVNLVVDRKVLAQAVTREKQDRDARR